MLIDFADDSLQTKIHVDSLSVDGYDIDNLIHKTQQKTFHKKYFMSEYYVKCPVKILLTFPCLVDISAIVINPKASSHCSKCIEVQAAYQRPVKNFQNDTLPCQYAIDLSKFEDPKLFTPIGKYNERNFETHEGVSRLVFYNERHSVQFQDSVSHFRVPLKPLACVSACSNILLNITWATIPIISELEVWGTASLRNPIFLKKAISDMLAKTSSPVNCPIETSVVSSQSVKAVSKIPNNIEVDAEENIPSEFMDPITNSIMTIPLILPSGNNIDQTTYDKFVAVENSYGRLPSDPFTGIVFHGSKQALPNTALKLRIDEFVLKNKQLVLPNIHKLGSGSGVQSQKNMPTTQFGKDLSSHIIIKGKLKRPDTSLSNQTEHTPLSKKQNTTANHKSALESSLNDAISQTLFSLPSCFSEKKIPKPKCLKCDNEERRELYQLLCSHLLCRICLNNISKTTKQCYSCFATFKHQDVKKYAS